jgi:putative ABC transport system substrate-binding protein
MFFGVAIPFGEGQMKRRGFITLLGGAAAWPLAAWAQQRGRTRHIGFLGPERRLRKMRQGLGDLGYVEGQNIVVEYRSSDHADRLSSFAAELVALKVEVIVASGSLAVRTAQQATRSIPIVMAGSSDPVGTGFVATLAHPGGNITGLSLQSPELSGKTAGIAQGDCCGSFPGGRPLGPGRSACCVLLERNERCSRGTGH